MSDGLSKRFQQYYVLRASLFVVFEEINFNQEISKTLIVDINTQK